MNARYSIQPSEWRNEILMIGTSVTVHNYIVMKLVTFSQTQKNMIYFKAEPSKILVYYTYWLLFALWNPAPFCLVIIHSHTG